MQSATQLGTSLEMDDSSFEVRSKSRQSLSREGAKLAEVFLVFFASSASLREKIATRT